MGKRLVPEAAGKLRVAVSVGLKFRETPLFHITPVGVHDTLIRGVADQRV